MSALTWAEEFERCYRLIEDALQYSGGLYAAQDIHDGIAEGRYQIWPGSQSVIVTEICRYPRAKAVNVLLGAGDLDELKRMAPCVLNWARANECEVATIYGRPGWTRVFKDIGAEPMWTVSLARL